MSHDETPPHESPPHSRQPPRTTAGRLLVSIETSGSVTLDVLASHLGVPVDWLRECRDGSRTLELEVQILLAALVTMLAPEHAALAQHLHGQAQSALRVRNGSIESRMTYYSSNRWFNR